jgi:hypothetical protein
MVRCKGCGHTPPDGSRYCNRCGLAVAAAAPSPELRWIYLDLPAAKDAAYLWTVEDRAELVVQLYERFAPFADDGWEWVVHPANRQFAGWLEREGNGHREVVGANLLCRRLRSADWQATPDAPHHVGAHRQRQLTRDVERTDLPPDRLRPARHG